MDKKKTMETGSNELIQELFDELIQTEHFSVRQRYTVLRRVLLRAMDCQLIGLSQVFPDASSKMLYLLREHRVRTTEEGKHLARAVNAARVRMRQRDVVSDDVLAMAWPFDLKAVCLFVSIIYNGVSVPAALAQSFPAGWQEEGGRQRAKDRAGRVIDCLRCSVDAWDEAHIFVTLTDDGRQMTVDYAHQDKFSLGDWSYIRPLLSAGMQLNLIRPREHDHVLYPELIILCPDSLISVTAVAGCFNACGTSPYWEVIRKIKPRPLTKYILLGNLAGQFLDEAAYGRTSTYAESVTHFFRHNALDIAACDSLDQSFHEEARRQQAIIQRVMNGKIHLGVRSVECGVRSVECEV